MTPSESDAEAPTSIWRSPYTKAVLVCLVLVPFLRLSFDPPPPNPQFQLPAYSLVDSRGQQFGSAELAGRVYVLSFVATRCQSDCSLVTTGMLRMQQRLQQDRVQGVHLVSLSVDPDFDTPEKMQEFGTGWGVDPERWTLLTGPVPSVRALLDEGFGLRLEPMRATTAGRAMDEPVGGARGAIGHRMVDASTTAQLVLVDRYGQVRGFYGIDELGFDEVFHRAQHVLKDRRLPLSPDA